MPGRGPNTEKGGDWDTLFRLGTLGDWPDGRLLRRFLDRKEEGGEAAFDALVKRHGPMVWRTCRGSLADRHAAEDAFQATFLVLAERAGSIRNRDSIAGWLYGVARKIAARMRSDASRRPTFEARAARPEAVASPLDDRGPIDREALLREVDRLPSHYRGAIVLHDLGGFSYEETADRLGCPIGTVKARLHRARALLRTRLEARGGGGFSPAIGLGLPLSLLPKPLAARTVRSAVSLAIGRSATGAIPPAVAASTRWMLNAMIISQYKAAASMVAVGFLLCAGGAAAVVASQGLTASNPPPPPALATRPPAPLPVASPPRQEPSLTPEAIDRRAEEVAAGLFDPRLKADTLLSLGQAQIRRGQRDEGLATLNRAREAARVIPPLWLSNPPQPIGRIAVAMAQAGDREAALETFRESIAVIQALDAYKQSSEWFTLIPGWLRELGREEIHEAIEPYLAFAPRDPFQRVAVTEVQMQATAGEVASALEMTRTSPEFQGDGHSRDRLSALVVIAYALLPEDGERIDEVLAEAKTAAMAEPEPDPEEDRVWVSGVATFALLNIARVEAKLGRFDDALETCRSAVLPGPGVMTKDLRFYRAKAFLDIAEEQVASDEQDGARDSVNEALQIVELIDEPSRNVLSRQRAARILIRLGDLDKARKIISGLDTEGPPNSDLWRLLASARREAGDKEGVRADLINAMRLDREALDVSIAPIYYGGREPILKPAANVARDLLGLGNTEGAISLVDELPEESRAPFLPELAGVLAEHGELDAAYEVIGRIDDPKLRDRAIYRVALGMPGEAIKDDKDEEEDGSEQPDRETD